MSIKLKYLCLAHRKHTVPPMNDYRKEEINSSPLEADGNQETFDFTPSPFSIKEAGTLTQARWFFGTQFHHLLGLLTFWMKSLFLTPTTHLSIYWPAGEQYELGLGNNMSKKWTDIVVSHWKLGDVSYSCWPFWTNTFLSTILLQPTVALQEVRPITARSSAHQLFFFFFKQLEIWIFKYEISWFKNVGHQIEFIIIISKTL